MSDSQRIDKWLWHARVARTRTAAAALVTGGHVRVNRSRVAKPSHAVRPDDVVTVATPRRVLVLRITTLAARRGPAVTARQTYEDLSPPAPPHPPANGLRARGAGRPTKRDRRELEAWKRNVPPSGDSAE